MTRKEEMYKASIECSSAGAHVKTFMEGAEWAEENIIKQIQELIKINTDSTGNCDTYFTGMTNGMICILSCLTEKEPDYINSPKTK